MLRFKNKVRQFISDFGDVFNKEVANQRRITKDNPLALGALSTLCTSATVIAPALFITGVDYIWDIKGIGGASIVAMCGIYPAGIVTTIAGATVASSLTALGQVIKEKLQENKLDFSLGVGDKIKNNDLTSKICKMVREVSGDKEKFAKFADMVELSKDDTSKIKELIEEGEKAVKAQDRAKGKKDYSQEFAILS